MLYLPKSHPSLPKLLRSGLDVTDSSPECGNKVRKIVILNLMPQKQEAEEELYLMMGGVNVDIQVVLAKMSGLKYKTTPQEYMDTFYTDIAAIMSQSCCYDGLIVTGAPLEQYDYTEVRYWEQLHEVYRWSLNKVRSTLNVCWGAFASLKIFFNINKYWTERKLFGLYEHDVCDRDVPLLKDFPDKLKIPISRHITFCRNEIVSVPSVRLLIDQEVTGPELAIAWDGRHIFANGHLEYAEGRLAFEYQRDLAKGLDIEKPLDYFINDDPSAGVNYCWHGAGVKFYYNWITEYVCNDKLRIVPLNIEFKS